MVAVAAAVGGYWPVRNFLRTGNPINPIGVAIAGKTVFPDLAWENQFHAPYPPGTEDWSQAGRIVYSWLGGPEDWRWLPATYGSLKGGLGILWLLGCLPSLAYLAVVAAFCRRRRLPARAKIFAALVPIAILLFFAMPPHHNHLARYTIWLYGLGLPAFALAGEKLWKHHRRPIRRTARVWIVAVTILFLIEAGAALWYGWELTRRRRGQTGTSPGVFSLLARAIREPYHTEYPEGSLMEILLTGDLPVALGPLPGFRRLLLGRLGEGEAFGRRRIYFLDPATAEDPEELERFLKGRDVRFVVWDDEVSVPEPLAALSLLREHAVGGFYLLACNLNLRSGAAASP